ncbi:MAG: thioredoxin family protein [Planctomycetaceae bacterium]|nr:thioredoxin family protein [Planctomycetaceae bacterium]
MSRFGASRVVFRQRFPTPGAVPGLWALALALASGAPPAAAQAVQWRPDYGAARREAAAHQRPLVLVFSAASCPWCRQMERTTLRDPEVVGVLNRRFVPVQVAADDARNGYLVSGLGLRGLPAVVLVAPGGQVLTTREGFLDAAGFLALLDRAPARGAGLERGALAARGPRAARDGPPGRRPGG